MLWCIQELSIINIKPYLNSDSSRFKTAHSNNDVLRAFRGICQVMADGKEINVQTLVPL